MKTYYYKDELNDEFSKAKITPRRIDENYKKHNIYAVCSGEKPSMYGYIWVKILNDDIVQTEMKVSE